MPRWVPSSLAVSATRPAFQICTRTDQATTNFLETFPFFAALVLIAQAINRHGFLTVCGAQLYFWGRVGYLLAAAAGFGLVRSVVFWNAAVIGILLFLIAFL
jgi:uncharacterized MAPEG superfamily protein